MLILLGVVILVMFGIAGTFLSIEAKQRNENSRRATMQTPKLRQATARAASDRINDRAA